MNNATRIIFKPFFEHDLRLPVNPICEKCDAEIRHPLLPWLVGQKFSDSQERIMFVGKPHRGTPGEILPSGIIDPSEMVEKSLWHEKWPYWSYTREIAENLYGRSAYDFIAMSNLIKCTNVGAEDGSKSTDMTTHEMFQRCVNELGVIWKEFERLKPRTIVFYTYGLFRDLLQDVPVALKGTVKEITTQEHRVACGNKSLGWWERTCTSTWHNNLRFLVVGHPERMARSEYVALLTGWLRNPVNPKR